MSNSYFFSDINFNFATLSKFVLAFYGSKAYCRTKFSSLSGAQSDEPKSLTDVLKFLWKCYACKLQVFPANKKTSQRRPKNVLILVSILVWNGSRVNIS